MMKPNTVPFEIVETATGHVVIMHFVTNVLVGGNEVWNRVPTIECVERELSKQGRDLAAYSIRPIDPADLPSTRFFRSAWRSDGEKIAVDMALAREMHMADIRRARDAMLVRRDADWMREFSRGNAEAAALVEADRQVLRDIPETVASRVAAAITLEALRAVWPADLGDKA